MHWFLWKGKIRSYQRSSECWETKYKTFYYGWKFAKRISQVNRRSEPRVCWVDRSPHWKIRTLKYEGYKNSGMLGKT